MLRSLLKSAKGRDNGSSGGGRVEALTTGSFISTGNEGAGQGRAGRKFTVVDHNAGDAEDFFDFCEGIDDVDGVSEVAGNVQLAVGALCLLHRACSDGDFVAGAGERLRDVVADVWACTKDEDDGRRHRCTLV